MLHWIRLAPVTAETLIICVALFVSCAFQTAADREPFENVQRKWGAMQSLHLVEKHDGVRRVKEEQLFGPFDIWDGQWWRIPVSVFHHDDLIHLLITGAAGLYLGRLLEQQWSSFTTALFLIPASIIPIIAELSFGNAARGFSGAVCAMLGALVVLRQFDGKLSQKFPAAMSNSGVAVIVLCALATTFGVMACSNIAHFAGFFYGVIIATVSSTPLRKFTILWISVLLFHLWLIPSLFLVTHPFWVGRYHWYRAATVRNPKLAEKSLELAVECNPSLTGVWLRLAELAESQGDLSEGWRRIVGGLSANPASAPMMDYARRLWRHLDSRQRRDAELTLKQFFGMRAGTWLNSIKASVDSRGSSFNDEKSSPSEVFDVRGVALDQKIELPGLNLTPDPLQEPKLMDPEDPNNAAEGQPL